LKAQDKFAAVKGLIPAIPFHGPKVFPFDFFVGGETVIAR
jgi:hypothetical protein